MRDSWNTYYEATKSAPPNKLLLRAIEHVTPNGTAIDIGSGALKDTRFLLERGFTVTALGPEKHWHVHNLIARAR